MIMSVAMWCAPREKSGEYWRLRLGICYLERDVFVSWQEKESYLYKTIEEAREKRKTKCKIAHRSL